MKSQISIINRVSTRITTKMPKREPVETPQLEEIEETLVNLQKQVFDISPDTISLHSKLRTECLEKWREIGPFSVQDLQSKILKHGHGYSFDSSLPVTTKEFAGGKRHGLLNEKGGPKGYYRYVDANQICEGFRVTDDNTGYVIIKCERQIFF